MDIKIPHSWLTKYLETDATAKKIGECLALCGPSVERVVKFGNNDWLYEIEVTTNRVDMMSVYGIAREAATILPAFDIKASLKKLQLGKALTKFKDPLPLKIITDPKLSHRVMAVVLDNVEIGNSPKWLKQKLEANNIRSLNNIIDITNYIMTEIGHPCHVFDYDRIKDNTLKFRLSEKDEKITTLDNKTYQLPGNDIVIEDGQGRIVDLPGIMGTANSVVNNNTKRIILFIDNNDASMMRATSMTLGIRSVAVTLNEKHVDPELGETAILRGLQLYTSICKAKQASPVQDYYPNPPKTKTIKINKDFIDNKIGVTIKDSFIKRTFKSLGFEIDTPKPGQYKVTVPTWRLHDITIPIDLVEEISRVYGYHNLPSIIPEGELPPANPQSKHFYWEYEVKVMLKNLGFTENFNYSLISDILISQVKDNPNKYLKLKNPLTTDWLNMRRDIYPSLLQSASENQNRVGDINFFELSNIYLRKDKKLPDEIMTLSILKNNSDFYDLKGIVEYIAAEMNLDLEFKSTDKKHPNLNSQIQADIYLGKNKIGFIGQTSLATKQAFELKNDTFIAQLNFQALAEIASKDAIYTSIPKHPAIIENYTFFNKSKCPASDVLNAGKKTDSIVKEIKIIDFYEDKINLEISYQNPKKNLTDKDITPIRKKLVKNIEKLGLTLQGNI